MKRLIIALIACSVSFITFAQKSKSNAPQPKTRITVQSGYTCTMHPDVKSNKPGKCPKCNMDLTLSKKEQMKSEVVKVYTCPMHTEVVSDKPGKCPECSRSLTLSKKEQMKMDVMNLYTCSMHPEVKSQKPGKCAKCGMALTAKKDSKK